MRDAGEGEFIALGERRAARTELVARAHRAAAGLREQGVGPGDAVALILRNDFAFLEASLAAGYLGAYPVAINWHATAPEAAYILEDCGAKAVVIHDDLLQGLEAALPSSCCVLAVETPSEIRRAYRLQAASMSPRADFQWDAWLSNFSLLPEALKAQAPGTMIYTSGTTGHPKGVRRTAPTIEQANATAGVIAATYGLSAGEDPGVTLIAAPLYHSAPNIQAMAALRIGGGIVLQPRFDPEEFLQLIEHWRVTHLYVAPIMFTRLLQLPADLRERYEFSSLQHVVHAAAPCAPDIKSRMIDWWGPIIHEFYGCTETRGLTACTTAEWLSRPGTVGRPVPGAIVRILDSSGVQAPAGVTGEIAGVHPDIADFTYHGDPKKRQAADRDGLIATGDVGYLDEAGYLFICDRATDMIISGGVNIYPAEIEAGLCACTGVLDAAVFGVPDDEYGESVMAVVQSVDGKALDLVALKAELRTHIAGFKVPRQIQQTDALPRQDSGKIFKRKLRQPFWDAAGRSI